MPRVGVWKQDLAAGRHSVVVGTGMAEGQRVADLMEHHFLGVTAIIAEARWLGEASRGVVNRDRGLCQRGRGAEAGDIIARGGFGLSVRSVGELDLGVGVVRCQVECDVGFIMPKVQRGDIDDLVGRGETGAGVEGVGHGGARAPAIGAPGADIAVGGWRVSLPQRVGLGGRCSGRRQPGHESDHVEPRGGGAQRAAVQRQLG